MIIMIEEEENKYYVYRHVRPDLNVPFYIGIGTIVLEERCFKSRYKRAHERTQKRWRSEFWRRVYNKNEGNILIEIIWESSSLQEVKDKEIEFIKLYGRRDKGLGTLCNLTDGGDGIINISDELRKKRSERMKNFKFTDEMKAKLSKSLTGKKRTPEMLQRYSAAKKGKKNPKFAKKIFQYTKEGEFIREWYSISEAQTTLKVHGINDGLKDTRNKRFPGGFKWTYATI